MYDKGKPLNVIMEMNNLNRKKRIRKARWINCGQSRIQDKFCHYSVKKDKQQVPGVAFILDETFQRIVKNFLSISPCVSLLQLEVYSETLNLIQVYAPTADKIDEEVESLYKNLDDVMKN